MRSYGQFCPIARGSEILAERWTPIILRNVLGGAYTFNEIAAGAPGLSRALLTRRLHELERHGVIQIHPKPAGRGSLYEPTPAGQRLWPVLCALGDWAEGYSDLTVEQSDPGVVLWSWSSGFLRRDLLPDRRIVVRFESEHRGKHITGWLVIDKGQAEVCRRNPGFGDDLVVTITDRCGCKRLRHNHLHSLTQLYIDRDQVKEGSKKRRNTMRNINFKKMLAVSAFAIVAILGMSDVASAQWNNRNQKQQEKIYKQQQKIQKQQQKMARQQYRIYRNGSYYNTDNRGAELLRQAVNRGYQQGLIAGRNDRIGPARHGLEKLESL